MRKKASIDYNNMGGSGNSDSIGLLLPPRSIDAERALVSSIIIDNSQVNSAIQLVAPEDFYDIVNYKVFKAITLLTEKGEPIDIVTLNNILSGGLLNGSEVRRSSSSNTKNKLSFNNLQPDAIDMQSQDLSSFDWAEYLTGLMELPAGLLNVDQYAKIVKEKSILRRLINAAHKIQRKCYEQKDLLEDVLDFTEKTVFDVTEKNTTKSYYEMYPLVLDYFKKLTSKTDDKDISGVHSGFRELDIMTNGFQPSDFIIIAGRPSMGKTAFALSIAKNVSAGFKIPMAFFSLEMSKEQLVTRLISQVSRIDSSQLRRGKLHNPDIESLQRAMTILENVPIYIDDSAGISVMELRAKTRRLKMEKNIGLVVVDYLQLMKAPSNIESREQAIADISRSIKALAKELKIPIIALSQLNRLVESRSDRRPQLADLRESGAIEQDADVILFIYREDVYKKDTDKQGVAEIIIGKQRNGPTGIVNLTYVAKYTSFENPSNEASENF
ncbi:MAG: replicative DNA helicase [bacterium]